MDGNEDRWPWYGDDALAGDDSRGDYDDGRVTDADFAGSPDCAPSRATRPLYDGRPIRDPYDRGGGYRRTSDTRWEAIRDAYLSGETATSVCARFGLSRSSLHARAAEEGWRRQDQPEDEPLDRPPPDEPVDLEAETAAGLPDYGVMATHALVRMQRAILNGWAMEAGRWLRLHTRLTTLAKEVAAASAPQAEPAPSPTPSATAPRPEKASASQAAALTRMRTIQTLARAAAGLNPHDSVGRLLLNKSLAILDALEATPPPTPVSDKSDSSDAVFQSEPPP